MCHFYKSRVCATKCFYERYEEGYLNLLDLVFMECPRCYLVVGRTVLSVMYLSVICLILSK